MKLYMRQVNCKDNHKKKKLIIGMATPAADMSDNGDVPKTRARVGFEMKTADQNIEGKYEILSFKHKKLTVR